MRSSFDLSLLERVVAASPFPPTVCAAAVSLSSEALAVVQRLVGILHNIHKSILRLVLIVCKFSKYYALVFPNGSSKCVDFQTLEQNVLGAAVEHLLSLHQELAAISEASGHSETAAQSSATNSIDAPSVVKQRLLKRATEIITSSFVQLEQLLTALNFNFKKLILRNVCFYSVILKDKVLSNEDYSICNDLINDTSRFQILLLKVTNTNLYGLNKNAKAAATSNVADSNVKLLQIQVQNIINDLWSSSFNYHIHQFESLVLNIRPIKGYLIEKYNFNKQLFHIKNVDMSAFPLLEVPHKEKFKGIENYATFLQLMVSDDSSILVEEFQRLSCMASPIARTSLSSRAAQYAKTKSDLKTFIHDITNFNNDEFYNFYRAKSPMDYDYSMSKIVENDTIPSMMQDAHHYASENIGSCRRRSLSHQSQYHSRYHGHRNNNLRGLQFLKSLTNVDSESSGSMLYNFASLIINLQKVLSSLMPVFHEDGKVSPLFKNFESSISLLFCLCEKLNSALEELYSQINAKNRASLAKLGRSNSSSSTGNESDSDEDESDQSQETQTPEFQKSVSSFLLNANYVVHLYNLIFVRLIGNYLFGQDIEHIDASQFTDKVRVLNEYFFAGNLHEFAELLLSAGTDKKHKADPLGNQVHRNAANNVLADLNARLLSACHLPLSEHLAICFKLQHFVNYVSFGVLMKNDSNFNALNYSQGLFKIQIYTDGVAGSSDKDSLQKENVKFIEELNKVAENVSSSRITFGSLLNISVSDFNLIQTLATNLWSNDENFQRLIRGSAFLSPVNSRASSPSTSPASSSFCSLSSLMIPTGGAVEQQLENNNSNMENSPRPKKMRINNCS